MLGKHTAAKAGDLVVFDFSHIGLVVKDQISSHFLETIEGNTNAKSQAQRDSAIGDGVWRKRRDAKLVRSLIRIL